MTLPNFVAIGPGKTGTTWLYECLREHPQISLARHTKETVFFTDYYARGLAWYEKFFSDGAVAIGEVSNTYFFSREAAIRMASDIPQAKLIVFLRHPVDRLVSYYLFQRRNGRMAAALEDAIARDPTLVSQNFFDDHLEPWLAHFPREQIFVALHDDLMHDAGALLRDIYRFLGVDPDFTPRALGTRALPASAPRNAALSRAAKQVALWLRRRDLHWLLGKGKNSLLANRLLTRPLADDEANVLSPQLRARLQAIYRPHMERTQRLIGRDLSAWL